MQNNSNSLSVRTLWVSLLLENEEQTTLAGKSLHDIKKELFGEKSSSLQPIVSFPWIGEIRDSVAYLKQSVKLTVPLKPFKVGKLNGNTLSDTLNNAKDKIKIWLKDLEKPPLFGRVQDYPFTVIDLKLKSDFIEDLKDIPKEILNLLLAADIKEYDYEIYKTIGIMKNNSLLNLASLKKCFLSLSPKSVLIIRHVTIPDENILPNTLEAASMIAIAFVGYRELLSELANWERKILKIRECIKNNNKEKKNLLEDITDCINKLIKYNHQSSSLLEFHMSYATSSIVAQNFFKTFSNISGLEGIHYSLLTKLENCSRLLNCLIDYHQFKEIQTLRGSK